MPGHLSIGEVAEAAGVRTSALRFYEQEGLVLPVARESGRRRYDLSAVDQVLVIRFAQELGFSLAEIRGLLTPPRGRAQKERWRGLVDAKLAELDDAVARARALRKTLLHSRDCDCIDLAHCRLVLAR